MLATTWRSSMTVTGFDGCPATNLGGNVIRGKSSVKLSFRLPPGADADAGRGQRGEDLGPFDRTVRLLEHAAEYRRG
jgi:hypothetical protein